MADFTFNPYPQIGEQLAKGLEFLATNLKPTSTVDEFADAIYKFVQPIYYPAPVSKQIEIEIKSVVFNMINAYNNKFIESSFIPGEQPMYGVQQMNIIMMMIGENTTDKTPIDALGSWLLDVQDSISQAGLSISGQTPLLLASTCGINVYNYWVNQTKNPTTWEPFFQKNNAINYANVPFWVAACIEGALLGASATRTGLIAPTTDIVSVNIISALIGALTIGAGKVIFKWVPRIQPIQLASKLSFNKEVISKIVGNSEGTGMRKPLSIFNWIDCGAHSPHWCNTGCGIKQTDRGHDADSDCETNSKL